MYLNNIFTQGFSPGITKTNNASAMHPYSEWTVILVFLVIEAVLIVKYGGKVVEAWHQYRENEVGGVVPAFRIILFILMLTATVLLDIMLWPAGKEG